MTRITDIARVIVMSDFSDRELLLLINSTHERAMRMLDISCAMSQNTYRSLSGRKPTKKDIDNFHAGHNEHIALVDKLRNNREFNPDWSLLESTQESLREHMALIKKEREQREVQKQKLISVLHEQSIQGIPYTYIGLVKTINWVIE